MWTRLIESKPFFPVVTEASFWLVIFVFIVYGTTIAVLNSEPYDMKAWAYAVINDEDLTTELVAHGISFPAGMAFLGPDDILVVDKNNGTVNRLVNGSWAQNPLLDVNVANSHERGMVGIATQHEPLQNKSYVYLYYTESLESDGLDVCTELQCEEDDKLLGNRLYRYELDEQHNRLVNPKLLLDLPATPGPVHNGGKMVLGPDKHIYLIVGDVHGSDNVIVKTKAQNYRFGTEPDGRAGILRLNGLEDQDTNSTGILGNNYPLNLYYAYGIRNGFGLAFDLVTDKLWDTENGPLMADELNLVEPGFNSGWNKVMGVWKPVYDLYNMTTQPINTSETLFQDFSGRGNYSNPEFTWKYVEAPTGLAFLDSDKLGKEYEDDLFVGAVNSGYIFHFDLNENRTKLLLEGPLQDTIADSPDELQNVIFGRVIGGVTDLRMGPDGYLYFATPGAVGGIYRIVPKDFVPNAKSIVVDNSSVKNLGLKILLNNSSTSDESSGTKNKKINFIESNFRIDSVLNASDNQVGVYWFDTNDVYHSIILKSNFLSYYSPNVGDLPLGLIDERENGRWYSLKIAFVNQTMNVFLDNILAFKFPYHYDREGIDRLGRTTHNIVAQFEPLKVARIPT